MNLAQLIDPERVQEGFGRKRRAESLKPEDASDGRKPRRPGAKYLAALQALRGATEPVLAAAIAAAAGTSSTIASAHMIQAFAKRHVVRDERKPGRLRYSLTPAGREFLDNHCPR